MGNAMRQISILAGPLPAICAHSRRREGRA